MFSTVTIAKGMVVLALLLFLAGIVVSGVLSVMHHREIKGQEAVVEAAEAAPAEELAKEKSKLEGLKKPAEVPGFIANTLATLGAALTTFFAGLFGISQFTGGNPRPIPRFWQVSRWATLPQRRPQSLSTKVTDEDIEKADTLQWFAAVAFLACLLIAGAFWAWTLFSDFAAEDIKALSKTLLGLLAGGIAVTLRVKE